MISGESRYHFSRPALMYIFMGHMSYQNTKPYEDRVWEERKITLVRDWVTGVDVDKKQLSLHNGKPLAYDKLLIATGSKPNKFGWPGQDLHGVQGLWGLPDLKMLYDNCQSAKRAVIVGGGLIGIELAEMLHSRGIKVTILVREKSYWDNVLNAEESQLVNEVIRENHLDLRLETELDSILDDGHNRVRAIRTKDGEEVTCEIVGLTAGVSPNVDLAKASGLETGRGLLVNWKLETKHQDIYAAGDCAEIETPEGQRNVIQQVWYTGKMQGEVVGDAICGKDRSYELVTWYNSAKFFDLEYQTYGRVNMRVKNEQNLYWQHPSAKKSLRIVHTEDEGVIGYQTMGIRSRHRVCQKWIEEQRSVEYVLEHLAEANFDPEFFPRYESEIRLALAKGLSLSKGGA